MRDRIFNISLFEVAKSVRKVYWKIENLYSFNLIASYIFKAYDKSILTRVQTIF